MQSIIGYSDDDRSDDEDKRSSPLKSLAKSQSKDSLPRRSVSISSLKASANADQAPLVNEPRDCEDTDTPSEPKQPVRAGKSKGRLDPSIVRRTTIQHAKSLPEQADEPTSNTSGDPKAKDSSRSPRLQDLSLGPKLPTPEGVDELVEIRALLRPLPIPGVENFGIPPPSEDPVDSELAAKISKFLALKKQGTHFNDILMRNKSFNNPHIYAKLVDFVEVNETGTNFPKNLWNPHDVQPEWYAEDIAAAQKKRSAEASAAQAPGKRSRIAFNSASSSSTSGVHPSTLDRGHRHSDETRGRQHSDDLRGKRSDGSRRRHEDDKRFHPYPHKPDTNMGWVPRNHSSSDRSRRW